MISGSPERRFISAIFEPVSRVAKLRRVDPVYVANEYFGGDYIAQVTPSRLRMTARMHRTTATALRRILSAGDEIPADELRDSFRTALTEVSVEHGQLQKVAGALVQMRRCVVDQHFTFFEGPEATLARLQRLIGQTRPALNYPTLAINAPKWASFFGSYGDRFSDGGTAVLDRLEADLEALASRTKRGRHFGPRALAVIDDYTAVVDSTLVRLDVIGSNANSAWGNAERLTTFEGWAEQADLAADEILAVWREALEENWSKAVVLEAGGPVNFMSGLRTPNPHEMDDDKLSEYIDFFCREFDITMRMSNEGPELA